MAFFDIETDETKNDPDDGSQVNFMHSADPYHDTPVRKPLKKPVSPKTVSPRSLKINQLKNIFSMFTHLMFSGLFAFFMLLQSQGLWFAFSMPTLGLWIGGGCFLGLAVAELVHLILFARDLYQAIQHKEPGLMISNIVGILSSLGLMTGSTLMFLDAFFPSTLAPLAGALGTGITTSMLMTAVPILFSASFLCLGVKSLLRLDGIVHSKLFQTSSISEKIQLLASPSLKALFYTGLSVCMGLSLVVGIPTGICFLAGAIGSLVLLGLMIYDQTQIKKEMVNRNERTELLGREDGVADYFSRLELPNGKTPRPTPSGANGHAPLGISFHDGENWGSQRTFSRH